MVKLVEFARCLVTLLFFGGLFWYRFAPRAELLFLVACDGFTAASRMLAICCSTF